MAEEIQKPKRRVRKVETVREKSAKSAELAGKSTRRSLIWHGFTVPFRLIGRGFKKIASFLARFKVFRILGRILVPYYFRNSWKELKQVTWPSGKQTRQLTIAVIIFAIIFGAVVALLDFILDKVFKEVLLK